MNIDVMPRLLPNDTVPSFGRMYETPMSAGVIAATRILHGADTKIDYTIVSAPEHAARNIYAAFDQRPGQEHLLLDLANEWEREILHHPAARAGQLFTLRICEIDAGEATFAVGGGITRIVTLPVESTTSPRGNLLPEDVAAFYDEWAASGHEALIFTACPTPVEGSDNIDRERERQILTAQQISQLDNLQGRILFEAMAASMQSLEAQTMLIGQLKNIRAQIGLYRQGGHSKEKLLEISQDLRGQSRGLMETLGTAAMQAALLPPHMQHLSGMLKGFQKELRATGILAEKQAPQIIVTSRAEVSIPAPAAAVMAAPAISTSAPASIQAIPASCEQTPVPQASAAEIKNAPVPGQPHASELAVKESRPVPKTESNAEPKVETASPVLTPPHVQSQVQAPSIKTEAVTRSASMAAAPQPRLTDGPLPSSPLTQERQAPSILPPAPPRMPADIWAQSKSDSQPDPRRASGNGPVAAPDDAKRDKSNFVHGLQIKTMIGDAIVVAKSAVAPLNPVTGKTEVKKTFKAAATGACAGCGGGDCAACTRGAKIAAMKTDLHAKYG